ncbi:uncharacterized protein LOC103316340 [Nasonia vitripennis]|uniref:Mutator-like transposase domain-containing protein n=1 Tax=Nasonia vitripennis TaxID=7425 RepID=A0A7M7H7A4_NASVI|nr:uncharacterized protein LOC103316340 [Nasonia vitripennis]
MNERPRYKGKIMTEKQYKRRMKQIESGLMRKKEKVQTKNQCDDDQQAECMIEGRRIIDLKVMAQHLYCSFCTEILSLEDIEKEAKKGLASDFTVRCRKCLATSIVPTSKVHLGPNGQLLYDNNTKAALSAIHNGNGHTTLKKFCGSMNMPCMTAKTYKSYEREIGPVIESVAKESCLEACKEEKRLTKSQLDILQKRL